MSCKAQGTGLNSSGGNPRVLSALKKSGERDDLIPDSVALFNHVAVSQDSLLSIEDDCVNGALAETGAEIMIIGKVRRIVLRFR